MLTLNQSPPALGQFRFDNPFKAITLFRIKTEWAGMDTFDGLIFTKPAETVEQRRERPFTVVKQVAGHVLNEVPFDEWPDDLKADFEFQKKLYSVNRKERRRMIRNLRIGK